MHYRGSSELTFPKPFRPPPPTGGQKKNRHTHPGPPPVSAPNQVVIRIRTPWNPRVIRYLRGFSWSVPGDNAYM